MLRFLPLPSIESKIVHQSILWMQLFVFGQSGNMNVQLQKSRQQTTGKIAIKCTKTVPKTCTKQANKQSASVITCENIRVWISSLMSHLFSSFSATRNKVLQAALPLVIYIFLHFKRNNLSVFLNFTQWVIYTSNMSYLFTLLSLSPLNMGHESYQTSRINRSIHDWILCRFSSKNEPHPILNEPKLFHERK